MVTDPPWARKRQPIFYHPLNIPVTSEAIVPFNFFFVFSIKKFFIFILQAITVRAWGRFKDIKEDEDSVS